MAHFIGIQGLLGAGKTTTASMLAHYYQNRVKALGGDIKLFSNYGLRGAEDMAHYSDWLKVADCHGSVIVWDEGQTQFDSREFSSADRVFATQLLNYCRKMNSVQIVVAPNFQNIDKRIRQLTEVLINVVKIGNKGLRLEYYDYQAGNGESNLGRFLHSRFLSGKKVRQIHSLNLFDTYRMVRGFPMPKTERQRKDFWVTLDEHHEAALDRLGIKRFSRPFASLPVIDEEETA
ncbi:ATPase [Brevibacillus borstelensis]|uniref:zonular occludens toxin domain-containing protein n=1 Tax=Brevibacillus borstelensis TaxID=45462 RepID=UPI00203D8EA8|nr:zonular occludens toxin domain-containing protein [Brevibacillus borstelensis]MCM3593644.1 ATPase [Brevibacillus borstelensis]